MKRTVLALGTALLLCGPALAQSTSSGQMNTTPSGTAAPGLNKQEPGTTGTAGQSGTQAPGQNKQDPGTTGTAGQSGTAAPGLNKATEGTGGDQKK
jgi:hypothetical protein